MHSRPRKILVLPLYGRVDRGSRKSPSDKVKDYDAKNGEGDFRISLGYDKNPIEQTQKYV